MIGRKPVMALSMIGNGLFLLGYIIFDHFFAYCFISFGAGFFNAFFHPAAAAMVADVTPDNQQTEVFGFLRMGMNIGVAVGPLLGTSVLFFFKNLIFILAAVSLILYGITLALLLEETLHKNLKAEETKKNITEGTSKTFITLLSDRILLFFIIAGLPIALVFSQTEGMLPLYFDKGLCNTLFSPLNIQLVNHDGTSAIWIYHTFGEMILLPVQSTFILRLAPKSLRGTYSGASNLHMILGGMIGPALSGYFLDMRQGFQFLLLIGFACIFSGLAYVLISRSVELKKSFPLITNNYKDFLSLGRKQINLRCTTCKTWCIARSICHVTAR
ncbi:MFS transporter [Parageobacillus thermoglucosidasius]|nr:MFS transporter [Parageobacillus thermoglucosidasius]